MTEVTPSPLKTYDFQELLNFTVLRPPGISAPVFSANVKKNLDSWEKLGG